MSEPVASGRRRSVSVYDPDSGNYLGSVDVCARCGEASCGTWTPCPDVHTNGYNGLDGDGSEGEG